MPKPDRLYQRLTRNVTGIGSYHSLWSGPDHLLIVRSTGYTESYQRIQFNAIRGFFILNSSRRLLFTILCLGLVVPFGIGMLNTLFNRETPIASACFFGLGIVLESINLMLGPSCRVFVVTKVQVALLPSLVRWRKAQKILIGLQPRVEEAQTSVEPTPAAAPRVS